MEKIILGIIGGVLAITTITLVILFVSGYWDSGEVEGYENKSYNKIVFKVSGKTTITDKCPIGYTDKEAIKWILRDTYYKVARIIKKDTRYVKNDLGNCSWPIYHIEYWD